VGRLEEARAVVAQLEEMKLRSEARAGDLWYLYVPLGDLDRAFECLMEAIELRDQDPAVVRLAPGLEAMRSDPRYHEVMRRYNLE
jgi:hypothetical protein